MLYIGLDPSFTGVGIITLNNNAEIVTSKLFETKSTEEMEDRIVSIWKEINKYIEKDSTIYMEGISHNSKGDAGLQLSALHYYIRIMLKSENLKYKVIPPTVLKKFITGKGNVKKNVMLLKVYQKFGIEFDNDNLADAYSLARMAYEEYK
jgi:crossover junction endodeoxyribonuclease RuvC